MHRSKENVLPFLRTPHASDIFVRAQDFLNLEAANDKRDPPMPLGLCIMLWLVFAGIGWTAFELLGRAI